MNERITLNIKNWEMTYEEHKNLQCRIPCSMYSVLLENKLIDDPFYGLNELKATELSEKGCVFESEFTADSKLLEKEFVEIEFYGLDTLCSVYINDTKIADVKNMHRRYVFNIKDLLVIGKNHIKLDFKAPIEYFRKTQNKHWIFTNPESIPGSSHLRKAFCMSGWDWGPMLPDMGIFRKVCIEAYNGDKIESIFVIQNHQEDKVTLNIEIETRHNKNSDIFIETDGKKIKLDKNKTGSIIIKNPKLWWVRGYGKQPLYEIGAKIVEGEEIIDEKSQKIGLRTLTLSTEPDDSGSEFCFVINGVKIFAMGANYIPQDSLLSRITPARTEKLIKNAIDANFNCLRVWGGGYYPEDEFYDLCDKYGILVWQDFMLACTQVWLGNEMRDEYVAEATDNVKRLRHHPSLGLLCGNNEIEQYLEWGLANSLLVQQDYIELFERIFPEICDKYAPQTYYRPSSPSSYGGFDNPTDSSVGDVHFWEVWHGNAPFTEYRKHKFRFCSEYGFESYPNMKTIKSFCDAKDMNCFSRVMENHQKCKVGNSKILMYLADNYLYPTSFEKLVYASQLLQADAIKYGVEHFRRCRPYCMGSLYWQFNDCWPTASWSSVDYFGRYKALHYAAKKFYAPVALGLFLEKKRITVNISNETMEDFEGKIKIFHSDTDFNTICNYSKEISVKPLNSIDVFSEEFAPENIYSEYIYAELYDKNDNLIMRQTELFVPPKYFEWKKPEIETKICSIEGKTVIDVSSNTFAKGVFIDFKNFDCGLSDNFFDITDRKPYRITLETSHSLDELEKDIEILSVYDIGKQ